MTIDKKFWQGKKVFVTGHTGFKGSWLCAILKKLDCQVAGYSLEPNSEPNLFNTLNLSSKIDNHQIADICDFDKLLQAIKDFQPDIVFHMAAQSLVKYSYSHPRETYLTNVIGTVNLLDAVKECGGVKSTIVVTSDKCYDNKEVARGYKEDDPMGGFDPYSNSKGCSELVASSFANSFFIPMQSDIGKMASVRAGNVIGGGDWSQDRLIPDIMKAIYSNSEIDIRSPNAIRPWQHVLEPLSGYMVVAQYLYNLESQQSPLSWNFGPEEKDQKDVGSIVSFLQGHYQDKLKVNFPESKNIQHEAQLLFLDISKVKKDLAWSPLLSIDEALTNTAQWYDCYYSKGDIESFTNLQIEQFIN